MVLMTIGSSSLNTLDVGEPENRQGLISIHLLSQTPLSLGQMEHHLQNRTVAQCLDFQRAREVDVTGKARQAGP